MQRRAFFFHGKGFNLVKPHSYVQHNVMLLLAQKWSFFRCKYFTTLGEASFSVLEHQTFQSKTRPNGSARGRGANLCAYVQLEDMLDVKLPLQGIHHGKGVAHPEYVPRMLLDRQDCVCSQHPARNMFTMFQALQDRTFLGSPSHICNLGRLGWTMMLSPRFK